MAVGDVGRRDRGEQLLQIPDPLLPAHLPHPVAHSVGRGEIAEGFPGLIPLHRPAHRLAGPVRQKNGAGLGVQGVHMADAVLLLLLPGILVLFDLF